MTDHLPTDHPLFGSAESQRLLLEISAILVDSLDYRTTLSRVARACVASLADVCFIDGITGEEVIERLSSAHIDPGQGVLVEDLSRQFAPDHSDDHPLIQVVRSGRTVWGDLRPGADGAHLRRLGALGCHAYVIVPLRARQRVLGALMLGRLPGTPAFAPGEVTLAEEVAGRVANAVEIAQLYESERRLRRLAERSAQRIALLQQVTAALAGALTPAEVAAVAVSDGFAIAGVSAGSMYRLSDDGARLEQITALNYPPSVIARYDVIPLDPALPIAFAVIQRQAFFIRDAEEDPRFAPALTAAQRLTGNRSFAMLPLLAKDRLIGVMGLSFRQPQEFSEEDRTLLLALSGQCAQALDRAYLFEAERTAKAQAEQAREQVRFLSDASIVLSSSLDLQTTLVTLAELAVQSLAEWCVLYIATLDGGLTRYVAAASQPTLPTRSWPADDRAWAGRPSALGVPGVMASGAPLLLPAVTPEALRDIPASEHQIAGHLKRAVSSLMVVPLVARTQILGTLSLARTAGQPPYTPADLDLVGELARRAAGAIENARLYQQSRRSEEAKRESLALLDALFDHAPVGMGFWDRDLRFVRVNPTLAAMNNVPVEDHSGRTLDELAPAVAASVRDHLLAVLRSGEAV
ncbi:MAG TPA: GAF domain-containing protein, partial [Herpetosiphonaceae bacterium]|nr:GAF domain-containing protein [Herpetosiphonaceae bacterium]